MECCGNVVEDVSRDFALIGPDGEYRPFYSSPIRGDPEFMKMVVRTISVHYCEKCGKILKQNVIGP